jgi:phosphate transport system protein
MVDPLAPHVSRDFDADMKKLREQLALMGERCRGQLRLALEAFWTGSKSKMADVEASDHAIDRDEKSIDELVLRILALRQPVAGDLRTLTATFRLVTDLERIGDEAVDIARVSAPSADGAPIREHLQKMAREADAMVVAAMASFLAGDAAAAEQVSRADDSVDALYRQVVDDTVAFMSQHPAEVLSAMSSMNVAKCLERIADHATNIAEGTLFAIRGEPMPR